MDINLLFENGMLSCGRVLRLLPEKDIGSPKQYMEKIFRLKTLPSINRLYPVILRKVINRDQLVYMGEDSGYVAYRIPSDIVNGLPIQSIKSLYCGTGISEGNLTGGYQGGYNGYIGNSMRLAGYPNRFGRYSSANLYETVVNANLAYADLQLLGSVAEAPIPRFEQPNIMWINKSYAKAFSFNITFCLDNDTNIITLDSKAYEAIKRLFIFDLKATIYDEYSTWSNLDTTLGTIDLKIDDWSGAESERFDYFNELDSMSHIRRHSIIAG